MRIVRRGAGGEGLLLLLFLMLISVQSARADGPTPEETLSMVRFDQTLDAQVPEHLRFRDDRGQEVALGQYFGQKPIILALVQYECPNLCETVVEDMIENLRDLRFNLGKQFDIITVSIDPRETPVQAVPKKKQFLKHYGRTGGENSWHALTGDQAAIKRLTDVVGYRYVYDPAVKQYAHPSGLVLLTPTGKISSYLYGLVYSATDLRLALVQASEGKIGSALDQLMLRCYRFDPAIGKYSFGVMQVVRGVGLITVLSLGLFIVRSLRR